MYLGFSDRFHAEKVRQFTAAKGQRPQGRHGRPASRRSDSNRPIDRRPAGPGKAGRGS
jgi:hypothetical protein